jgi:hypothetical protein
MAILRPGGDPVRNLTRALEDLGIADAEPRLRDSSMGLADGQLAVGLEFSFGISTAPAA